MEVIGIESRAWDMLKRQISILTSEVEAMKAQFISNPRGGWLDSADVCQLLGVSKRTLQMWRGSGKVAFSTIRRKVYFKESDIAALLKDGTQARSKNDNRHKR